jgi:hypothetical protein
VKSESGHSGSAHPSADQRFDVLALLQLREIDEGLSPVGQA